MAALCDELECVETAWYTKGLQNLGWNWFEGSMSRERDIWQIIDAFLEHGANDWYYDKDG